MPIAALLGGEQIIAPLTTQEQWEHLKHTARTAPETLVMRQTGHQCYPRVSPRGLRHFAHRAGFQATAPESIGHEMIKASVADTLQKLGWDAQLEVPQDGREWVADILATTPQGRKVAFEIQLSNQTMEETKQRTERYTKDGVWPVWITPHEHMIPESVDSVILNATETDLKKVSTLEEAQTITAQLYRSGIADPTEKPLKELVEAIATGGTERPNLCLSVLVFVSECWNCSEDFTAWESRHDLCVVRQSDNKEISGRSGVDSPLKDPISNSEVQKHVHAFIESESLPRAAICKTNINSSKITFGNDDEPGTFFLCPYCQKLQSWGMTIRRIVKGRYAEYTHIPKPIAQSDNLALKAPATT